MNFERMKLEIKEKNEITDHFRKLEKNGEFYPAYDSPLRSFDYRFSGLLPEGGIIQYLDDNYPGNKGKLIGIEIGGPGCKLFADLEGYFSRTAGITLYKKPDLVAPLNHDVIEADAFLKRINKGDHMLSGYQIIERWVKDNGRADLIISSMGHGYMGLSKELFLTSAKRWYRLLSETGTILSDIPVVETGHSFPPQLEKFLFTHRDIFDYSLSNERVRIRRLPGSPDSIDELVSNFKVGN